MSRPEPEGVRLMFWLEPPAVSERLPPVVRTPGPVKLREPPRY